jgi:hypothetical protein
MTVRNPRRLARHLMELIRDGDDDGMVGEMARLTDNRPEARLVLGEYLAALAEMMRDAADPDSTDPFFALELSNDDGSAIDIDTMRPPVRAAVRALLGELNGHPEEAEFQLRLALREPSMDVTVDVFSHMLMWTVGTLEWCSENDVPKPAWLTDLVSSSR